MGGPTHAVPKTGPLHFSIGQLQMSLPVPLSLEQLKGLPKVWCLPFRLLYMCFQHEQTPSLLFRRDRPRCQLSVCGLSHTHTKLNRPVWA